MKTPQGTPDASLVQAALEGSEDAFRQLVDRYKDYVFHLCVRVTGSRADADDMAQECFVKLYKNLGRVDPAKKLSNWLYTVALNDCRKLLRRRRLLRFFSLDSAPEGMRAPQAEAATPAPDQGLDSARLGAAIQKAVDSLPSELREVFVMRHELEAGFDEIAAAIGKKPDHARVLLFRARQRLRESLGPVTEGLFEDREG